MPSPCIVEGVDEEERHGAGRPAGRDVGGELESLRRVLGGLEQCLDGVLEGEVERLGGEVTQDVGQVS